jgi:hypothetical protein
MRSAYLQWMLLQVRISGQVTLKLITSRKGEQLVPVQVNEKVGRPTREPSYHNLRRGA